MDPWSLGVDTLDSRQEASGEDTGDLRERFVDNFCDRGDQITFERLPDSDEYLKLLESKLEKLTSGRNQKSSEESRKLRKTLVEDLTRVREDTLANLVTSCDSQNVTDDLDIDLERSLNINPVIRRLVPEQPLTTGEKVRLTRSDQLQTKVEEEISEPTEEAQSTGRSFKEDQSSEHSSY